MMNSSNTASQAAPERIDGLSSRSAPDARIEEASACGSNFPKHQEMPQKNETAGSSGSKPGGPVKELTAASALTALLVKPQPDQQGDLKEDFDIPQRFTKSGRKKATPFPMKLMKVLSQPEYSDIIAWLPDGKSFAILRPKAFVADILPGVFKEAKYSSFTRKLHRWGFQRHLRGSEAGAFFHKLFERGRLDLVEKMTCYKLDQGNKMPSNSSLGAPHGGNMTFIQDPVLPRHAGQHQMNRDVLLQQQQQQQQFHQQSLMMQQELLQSNSSPIGGSTSSAAGDGSVDRLNAAIELEVNRRLKERFAAATISRQALALMQQQQRSGGSSDLNFGGPTSANNNIAPLGLNLIGKGDVNSFTTNDIISLNNTSTNARRFSSTTGGQDGLGLNTASMQQQQQHFQLQQQLQLQQLQQQQAQQQQQQGMWGGQPFSFDNQGM